MSRVEKLERVRAKRQVLSNKIDALEKFVAQLLEKYKQIADDAQKGVIRQETIDRLLQESLEHLMVNNHTKWFRTMDSIVPQHLQGEYQQIKTQITNQGYQGGFRIRIKIFNKLLSSELVKLNQVSS